MPVLGVLSIQPGQENGGEEEGGNGLLNSSLETQRVGQRPLYTFSGTIG